MVPVDNPATIRKTVYHLLIITAMAMGIGRVLAVVRVYEPDLHREEGAINTVRPQWPRTRPNPMPTFGSNDRSRWATVRALVDEGTYVIGRRDPQVVRASAIVPLAAFDPLSLAILDICATQGRILSDQGIVFEDGWQTIDRVLHPQRLEFYSSKPPLLPTIVAGGYWLLKKMTGWTLKDHPFTVVRLLLVLINIIPFGLYLLILSSLMDRYGRSDWGRLFLMTTAAFGTLVTPFEVTFNNHSIAVITTLVALAVALPVLNEVSNCNWRYFFAGLLSGFTATCELPALALVGILGLLLLRRSIARSIFLFGLGALVPLLALLGTNYVAIGQFRPAYSEFGGPWYQYEGSIWQDMPWLTHRGIDWARDHETRWEYAFHLLIGHHGLFSLTPVFLLAFWAILTRSWKVGLSKNHQLSPHPFELPQSFFPAILLLSILVIGFYLFRSDNYGGVSPGPRWLLWLTPLWLVAMIPVLDQIQTSKVGRLMALIFLAGSVISASYPAWNPWRMPWIYRWLDSQGMIPY